VRTIFLSSLLALAVACGGTPATAPDHPTTPAQAFKPTSFTVEVSGTGRPVIFIPGLTCDGHVWDATVAHLGGKVQSHVITLAGFGGNAPITAPLMPTVHDELVAYIKQNHLEHAVLVGHSLGGFMTFWVASSAPDLLAGAVAVDGAPFLPALIDAKATVESTTETAKQMRAQITGGPPEQFGAGVRAFMGSMITDQSKHEPLIAAMTKSDPKTTGDAMYFLFQTDLRKDVGKITVPLVAIVADGNGQSKREELEATWHAQIDPVPHHDLVVIEHAKHFVMLDQPDAFYAALDRYLAGLEKPSH
jgi:pimeloyl-ACP methyl ester carboxylesterase